MSLNESSTTRPKSRRALFALAIAVPAVVVAIALPSLMGSEEAPAEAPPQPAETQPAPEAVAPATEAESEAAPELEAPVPSEFAPFAGGDLTLGVTLRWDRYAEGASIRAEITLRNLSLETVHVPAPGEPQPTLTLVVVDADGQQVRRIVEESPDALPRHTVALGPGATVQFPLDIIAPGETGLLPGTYRVAASFDTHDAWQRTGLPVWSAPAGTVHSEHLSFEVTPAAE